MIATIAFRGFLGGTSGKEPACQCRRQTWAQSLGQEIPWRREWLPIPVFLPGESHGQRSLVGYSQWDHQESDMTGWLTLTLPPAKLSTWPHSSIFLSFNGTTLDLVQMESFGEMTSLLGKDLIPFCCRPTPTALEAIWLDISPILQTTFYVINSTEGRFFFSNR